MIRRKVSKKEEIKIINSLANIYFKQGASAPIEKTRIIPVVASARTRKTYLYLIRYL